MKQHSGKIGDPEVTLYFDLTGVVKLLHFQLIYLLAANERGSMMLIQKFTITNDGFAVKKIMVFTRIFEMNRSLWYFRRYFTCLNFMPPRPVLHIWIIRGFYDELLTLKISRVLKLFNENTKKMILRSLNVS